MNLNELLDSVNWGTLSFNTFEPKKIEPTNLYEELLKRIRLFKLLKENPTILENPIVEEIETIGWTTPIIEQEPKTVRAKRISNNENYLDFIRKLEDYALQTSLDHDTMLKLEFLAGLESDDYKQNSLNKQGSTALGWFQFMDSTRHSYNKLSRKDFANDANAQFKAAVDHINFIDKAYISKWKKEIKDAGLNDFLALYGFWWNPLDMENFLKDNNYNRITKYNESIQKILKRAGYEKSNSNSRK